jgi:uncharacterized protein YjbI with pentapeptide repeats
MTLTAEQALERLRETGVLRGVTIEGKVDLAALEISASLPAAGRTYRLEEVTFAGPVALIASTLHRALRIERSRFVDRVHLQRCTLDNFAVRASVFAADLSVEDCEFGAFARFDGNDFQADVRFHLPRFLRRPSFADSTFRGRSEFLECRFGVADPATRATSFSDTIFRGPALFNDSLFHTRAKFQSAVFDKDASFLKVRMEGGASFRNVHFKGDAEFRFCRITTADFGDRENLTLFARRADFRGCEIERAIFDYTEFRGEASFVNLRLGAGGASFRSAYLGDERTDLSGLTSAGPLMLSDAYLSALHFHWRELRDPVLAAKPDTKVLTALHARLKELGDSEGALDAGYHLARTRFGERVGAPLPAPAGDPIAFADDAGERLIAYGEWLLWGLPTGYGTRLGRILLLCLLCWLLAAIPPASARGVLARVRPESIRRVEDPPERPERIYDPLLPEHLPGEPIFPTAFTARLRLALAFVFRVLFKVGPTDVRYVATRSLRSRGDPWRAYFATLWYLGSGLLVLTALTLANTSPIIEKLIGELLP